MPLTSSRIVPSENAFAVDAASSAGLVLRVSGGFLLGGPQFSGVPNATLTLTDNTVNYVEVSGRGDIQVNTTAFTSGAIFLYRITTLSGVIIAIEDWRANPGVQPPGVPTWTATVTLTHAQIRAAVTTGVEIVAAPGAGKAIVPVSAFMVLDHRAAAYTNVDGDAASGPLLQYSVSHTYAASSTAGWLFGDNNNGASKGFSLFVMARVASPPYAANDYLEHAENNALQVGYENNDLGNLTGGDPANTLTVTVLYSIVDV